MALCSLSAGTILILCSATRGLITGPPEISVSLLARAMSFLALMAAIVGSKPADPTIPVTTMSQLGRVAHATRPSAPCTTSVLQPGGREERTAEAASGVDMQARVGENCFIWDTMRSTLVPAARDTISKLSGRSRTMSSVCVPIEPVDPIRLIHFFHDDGEDSVVSKEGVIVGIGADGFIQEDAVDSLLPFA